ncbi:hypothetical protein R3Q06_02845 [Rhodococcus erythropolis]|uniref:hypothetical protein n=1 Tax=Rhodococcus erythropolis TaxID=1833 RepID=UPI0029494FD9|nr:hypothetical protein [Rhodococcus erythropolis]MDV6272430.1 hypothetical protein [Rhodococcus erythropolis]
MTLTEAIVCIGKPVIYTHPATLETEPSISAASTGPADSSCTSSTAPTSGPLTPTTS